MKQTAHSTVAFANPAGYFILKTREMKNICTFTHFLQIDYSLFYPNYTHPKMRSWNWEMFGILFENNFMIIVITVNNGLSKYFVN